MDYDFLSVFVYEKDSGKLFWKKNLKEAENNVKDGNKTYRKVFFKGERIFTHRVIWFIENGKFPSGVIDHIDGDGTNNKISNLRDVNHSINGRNRVKGKNNTSGYLGISWRKSIRRWIPVIKVNGKTIYLGCFENIDKAIEARRQACEKYGFKTF